MEGIKYTLGKEEVLEDTNIKSKTDFWKAVDEGYQEEGLRLMTAISLIKENITGKHDELVEVLRSGILSEITEPFPIEYTMLEVLKGKTYVKKKTTVEYTVITGGSEELANKFNCSFLHNLDKYYYVGSDILNEKEHDELLKKISGK